MPVMRIPRQQYPSTSEVPRWSAPCELTWSRHCAPSSRLLEDKMSDRGFQIPVDDRKRGKVKRGVRTHRHPEPARDRIDGSEHCSGNHGLFATGEPLD